MGHLADCCEQTQWVCIHNIRNLNIFFIQVWKTTSQAAILNFNEIWVWNRNFATKKKFQKKLLLRFQDASWKIHKVAFLKLISFLFYCLICYIDQNTFYNDYVCFAWFSLKTLSLHKLNYGPYLHNYKIIGFISAFSCFIEFPITRVVIYWSWRIDKTIELKAEKYQTK